MMRITSTQTTSAERALESHAFIAGTNLLGDIFRKERRSSSIGSSGDEGWMKAERKAQSHLSHHPKQACRERDLLDDASRDCYYA